MYFLNSSSKDDDTWISAADMMAGLMMIFLFIAIIYIQNLQQYLHDVSDVKNEICEDLTQEFAEDLDRWDMTICEGGLLIRFQSDTNFESASALLSSDCQELLDNFIPRLFSVIWRYKSAVSELRIEGHTDSNISKWATPLGGYIYNTKLSQDRSRNVLSYALSLPTVASNSSYLKWSFSNVTAHGMSSSDLILNGTEEVYDKSRRVEFRIKTNAEAKLLDLVTELKRNEDQ